MADSQSGADRRAGRVRAIVMIVCVAGIAGMIITSIADSTSGAMAFGLVTAAAVAVLVTANFVARDSAATMDEQAIASRIEADFNALVGRGHDQFKLRRISRDAFELGRRSRQSD